MTVVSLDGVSPFDRAGVLPEQTNRPAPTMVIDERGHILGWRRPGGPLVVAGIGIVASPDGDDLAAAKRALTFNCED